MSELEPMDAERLHVLVIDDDPDIRRLLEVRIRARGRQVTTRESADAAVPDLEQIAPDLIVCDISMPGMDGLSFLAYIQEHQPEIPVILATAFGSEQIAIQALRQGASDYIRKPFTGDELRAVLDRNEEQLLLRRQNERLRARVEEQQRQLAAELRHASTIQADLLPSHMPTLPGWDLAARCLPARDVGGDFFDWQVMPSGLGVTLADVMGKGVPAALLMATVRAALRSIAPNQLPADLIRRLDVALYDDLTRSSSFVTLVHARLDTDSGQLAIVDAGHGLGFIYRNGLPVELLTSGGLPIGIDESPNRTAATTALEPNDALILFSDGFIDYEPGLLNDRALIESTFHSKMSASEMIDALFMALPVNSAPIDDLTALVLKRAPAR